MDLIKTLAYAGLGLAKQTNDKMKTQFDEFVEVGKKSDIEGKNLVGDFFKTVDTTREEFESQISKNKNKIEERFPFIKDFEDRINELSKIKKEEENEVSSKENETVDTTIISEEETK
jgi:polyhydroxyalkanoate synthesis regulator phasin